MATASGYLTTESCHTCSCSDPATATGFKRTRLSIQRYYDNVENQWNKHDMPPMDSTQKWKVYEFTSYIYEHYSLFFECQSPRYRSSRGFSVWLKIAPREVVIPITTLSDIQTELKQDFQCLGYVTCTAENIMDTGLACLEEFGDYHYHLNNCQHFSNKLAKKLLGKKKEKKPELEPKSKDGWSTGEVLAWGVAGAAVLGGLAALFSTASDDQQEEQERRRR